ncbi:Uncharacterised protein [Corynebacterium urealyticum]|nr:Uncharacterised protein [Corynebacterium urealyticum]
MLQCWQTAAPGKDATVYEPLEDTYTLELNGETRMFDTATDSWTPDEDLSESVLLNRDTDDKPTITSGGEADAIDWRAVKCSSKLNSSPSEAAAGSQVKREKYRPAFEP